MKDIILITADSVRYDFVDEMDFIASKDIVQAKTAAHYTRPSLASFLSSSYVSAGQSRVMSPSLPEVLSDEKYTCMGFACSPQLDEAFGFGEGFDQYTKYGPKGSRGNPIRERLSQVDLLRRLYHRFNPPHSKIDDLPTDKQVLSEASQSFNDAPSPRFLWVHLIDTHRPYGRENSRIPVDLDKKAVFANERLGDGDHGEIVDSYVRALHRTDEEIKTFVEKLDTNNSIFVFTSDHGDEFGEEGRYFHQPQRRRVVDNLITVPIAVDGLDIDPTTMSLVDVAPTITGAVGADTPSSWDGYDLRRRDRDYTITIAPWNERATVRVDINQLKMICDGKDLLFNRTNNDIQNETEEIPDRIKDDLRDLGYIG